MAERHTEVKNAIPDEVKRISLDANVCKCFPADYEVIQSIGYGTAAWTRASRIIIEHPSGDQKSYFLKCADNELGRNMIEGEYLSMKEIHSYLPDFVPQPIARGSFATGSPRTFFFLMEFIDFGPDLVEPPEFCHRIAELHKMSRSPTDQFGFQMTTVQGPNPQTTTWESDWCTFYTRLITDWFERELEMNGPDPEYEATFRHFTKNIIPRILRPLTSEGRSVKPSLIHGDLWTENTGLNLETGKPVVFDASAMYAHSELELGYWRKGVLGDIFGRPYLQQYLALMPPSEPVEQFEDRNRLYSMKFTLSFVQGWRDNSAIGRQRLLDDMHYLTNKYPVDP